MAPYQDPYNVQVELVEGCNRMCDFCGIQSIWKYPKDRKIHYMDPILAERIALDLGGWFEGRGKRVEFAMHGEPTLHPDLIHILSEFRRLYPAAQLQITTNGIKLLKGKPSIDSLMVHTNVLIIDTYDNRQKVSELLKGVQWPVYDYYDDPKAPNPYHYHNAKFKGIYLFRDLGSAGKKATRVILNHAGNSDPAKLAKLGIPKIPVPLAKKCSRPFRELIIHWDGTVPICCMDWRHEHIIGKFPYEGGFKKLWNKLAFQIIRELLYAKDRNFLPCYRCDYNGGFRLGFLKRPGLPQNWSIPQMQAVLLRLRQDQVCYTHNNATDPFFPAPKNIWGNKW